MAASIWVSRTAHVAMVPGERTWQAMKETDGLNPEGTGNKGVKPYLGVTDGVITFEKPSWYCSHGAWVSTSYVWKPGTRCMFCEAKIRKQRNLPRGCKSPAMYCCDRAKSVRQNTSQLRTFSDRFRLRICSAPAWCVLVHLQDRTRAEFPGLFCWFLLVLRFPQKMVATWTVRMFAVPHV